MNKTKPIGVRFDPEKLDFIKTKEKLKSNQQVVDLLVNKYWWEHKMPIPTHKEAPPLSLKEREQAQAVQPSISSGSAPLNPLKLMNDYWAQKKELENKDQFAEWLDRLKADNRLSSKQKESVINTTPHE